jgi:hypothetical protein
MICFNIGFKKKIIHHKYIENKIHGSIFKKKSIVISNKVYNLLVEKTGVAGEKHITTLTISYVKQFL